VRLAGPLRRGQSSRPDTLPMSAGASGNVFTLRRGLSSRPGEAGAPVALRPRGPRRGPRAARTSGSDVPLSH
jgi:hypothetical protein